MRQGDRETENDYCFNHEHFILRLGGLPARLNLQSNFVGGQEVESNYALEGELCQENEVEPQVSKSLRILMHEAYQLLSSQLVILVGIDVLEDLVNDLKIRIRIKHCR